VRSAAGVSVAAVAAALSTLLITIIAARALTHGDDASRYSEFIVFWSLLFWCYGIVVGIQQEATRSVRARAVRRREGGARVLLVALALGSVVAVVVGVSAPLWSDHVLPLSSWVGAIVVAIGSVLYALYAGAVGSAGGTEDWGAYAGLMSLDALGRLALVGLAAVLGAGLVGIEVASVVISAAAVLVLLVPRLRTVRTARADRGFWPAVGASAYAMASSTASALLVVGYPVLVSLVVRNAAPGELAATMTVVQLTRAPIMMPLLAFQSVAVAAFVGKEHPMLRDLAKPVGLVVVVGIVGAPLAAWLGPWLLRLLYGSVYVVGSTTFAVLVLAAVAMAMLTLTGTLALAVEGHRGYMAGWIAAVVAAVLLLMLPFSLDAVVSLSLGLAPFFGMAIHVVTVIRRLREPRSIDSGAVA